jgi:VanZ family protein
MHAAIYTVLAALAAGAFRSGKGKTAFGLAGFYCMALACAIEMLQPMTGRTFSVADIAANAAGVAFGLLVALIIDAVHAIGARPR